MNPALPWMAFASLYFKFNHYQKIKQQFTSLAKFFSATHQDLIGLGFSSKKVEAIKQIDWNQLNDEHQLLCEKGIHILTIEDEHYPDQLKQIADPPPVLFAEGNVSLLSRDQIAMVGSRHPTQNGQRIAFEFARSLSSQGLVITSGLAAGIDTFSHQGALKEKGETIAVMGTGLNYSYPHVNKKMRQQIAHQGLVLSEFSWDTPPRAHHFPIRNRIISGLSKGVLIVEAAQKSGSLITANMALEQNREVFAIPGSVYNPLAKGCHALIKQGAKLVEEVSDILSELSISQARPIQKNVKNQNQVDLDPRLQGIYEQIGFESTSLDVIILRSGLSASDVSSLLISLELAGLIGYQRGGYVRLGF